MKTFWFFWALFRRAYDSAYDSDSVASENQDLWDKNDVTWPAAPSQGGEKWAVDCLFFTTENEELFI